MGVATLLSNNCNSLLVVTYRLSTKGVIPARGFVGSLVFGQEAFLSSLFASLIHF